MITTALTTSTLSCQSKTDTSASWIDQKITYKKKRRKSWVLSKLPSDLYWVEEAKKIEQQTFLQDECVTSQGMYFKATQQKHQKCKTFLRELSPWLKKTRSEKSNIDCGTHQNSKFDISKKTQKIQYITIKTLKDFESYFYPAAYWFKEKNWISDIDFKNNILAGVILPEETKMSQICIENMYSNNEVFKIKYRIQKEPLTFKVRCGLILLLPKGYTQIDFEEVNVLV